MSATSDRAARAKARHLAEWRRRQAQIVGDAARAQERLGAVAAEDLACGLRALCGVAS